MPENIKFTVSLIRKGYTKEVYQSNDIDKISRPGKELAEYEQIPLIIKNTSVSVFQTDYNKQYEEGIEICEELSKVGEFCPTEKLNQTILKANFYHSNSPYAISYGYKYTDKYGFTTMLQFPTQEERDKSALQETGYEFGKLDWIDRVIPTKENHDSSKKAVKC